MTREEAIAVLEESKRQNEVMRDNPSTFWVSHQMADGVKNAERRIAALDMALSALRPVSREQVEKVFPGCEKCRNQANWPSWIEKGFVYCPKCGTPLTSWAWEKQVERLEALKDGDLE